MPTKKTDPQPDPTPNDNDDDALDPDVEQFAKDWGEMHSWKSDMQAWREAMEQEREAVKRGSGTDKGQPPATTPDPQDGQNAQNSGQGQGVRAPRVPTRQPDTAPKSEHRWFRKLGK